MLLSPFVTSSPSPGGGNGNPLQYSCLWNPMDRGACALQSMGLQKAGHDWVHAHITLLSPLCSQFSSLCLHLYKVKVLVAQPYPANSFNSTIFFLDSIYMRISVMESKTRLSTTVRNHSASGSTSLQTNVTFHSQLLIIRYRSFTLETVYMTSFM